MEALGRPGDTQRVVVRMEHWSDSQPSSQASRATSGGGCHCFVCSLCVGQAAVPRSGEEFGGARACSAATAFGDGAGG